jgi:hypothetical protein
MGAAAFDHPSLRRAFEPPKAEWDAEAIVGVPHDEQVCAAHGRVEPGAARWDDEAVDGVRPCKHLRGPVEGARPPPSEGDDRHGRTELGERLDDEVMEDLGDFRAALFADSPLGLLVAVAVGGRLNEPLYRGFLFGVRAT